MAVYQFTTHSSTSRLCLMSVHCDCDGAVLKLGLHHVSRMSSQLKHSKVVIVLRLRSGSFLRCCHDIVLNPQQGVTYKNWTQAPKSLKSIKIVSMSLSMIRIHTRTHMHTSSFPPTVRLYSFRLC